MIVVTIDHRLLLVDMKNALMAKGTNVLLCYWQRGASGLDQPFYLQVGSLLGRLNAKTAGGRKHARYGRHDGLRVAHIHAAAAIVQH